MQQKIIRMKPFLSACAIGAALALTASAQSVVTAVTETPGNYSRDTRSPGRTERRQLIRTTRLGPMAHTPITGA
jgi:hypothetical protein